MKIAFLTDLKNHDRIIKSINQRISSKEQLREGYLTTQVAFYLIDRLDYPIMFSEACQESDFHVFIKNMIKYLTLP